MSLSSSTNIASAVILGIWERGLKINEVRVMRFLSQILLGKSVRSYWHSFLFGLNRGIRWRVLLNTGQGIKIWMPKFRLLILYIEPLNKAWSYALWSQCQSIDWVQSTGWSPKLFSKVLSISQLQISHYPASANHMSFLKFLNMGIMLLGILYLKSCLWMLSVSGATDMGM